MKLPVRTAALVSSALLIATACNYKASKAEPGLSDQPTVLSAAAVPSFSELTSSILEAKCFTCHDGNSAGDLNGYSKFTAVIAQVRARILSSGSDHMPRKGSTQLTPAELQTLLSWIDKGAPENGSAQTSTPPAAPPPTSPPPSPEPVAAPTATPVPSGKALGFEQLKTKVLNAKCITCHVGTDPVGDSDDFSTYGGTFAFKGSIRKRVLAPLDSPLHMPPLGDDHQPIPDRPQLTDAETQAIVNWVDAGGPLAQP